MIKVTVEGGKDLSAYMAGTAPAIDNAILDLAEHIYDYTVQGAEAHFKIGDLVRSLGSGAKKVSDGWIIEHDLRVAKYAPFVHWGTPPHVIRPKNKKALQWVSGNNFITRKSANHPGYRGDPYMVRAAARALTQFDAILTARLNNVN